MEFRNAGTFQFLILGAFIKKGGLPKLGMQLDIFETKLGGMHCLVDACT